MKICMIVIVFLLTFFGLSFAEDMVITTYYPSPFGAYSDLSVSNTLTVGTAAQPAVTAIEGAVTINSNNRMAIRCVDDFAVSANSVGIVAPVTITGDLRVTGTIRGTLAPSDVRFKRNIQELSGTLDKIKNLKGVAFDWRVEEFPNKKFDTGRQIGFIAQDVEKEFPELVSADSEGYKALDYSKFTAILLEAVKEQQKRIETLEKEIAALKAK